MDELTQELLLLEDAEQLGMSENQIEEWIEYISAGVENEF